LEMPLEFFNPDFKLAAFENTREILFPDQIRSIGHKIRGRYKAAGRPVEEALPKICAS